VRRTLSCLTTVLVVTAVGHGTAAAQDVAKKIQTRVQERIVISQELAAQINQLVQTTLGAELGRQIGQDVGRTVRDVVRSVDTAHGVPHDFEQGKDFKFEQKDTQTKTLSIGASGDLTLRNVVGDITVKAGGGRDVTVEIVRVSKGKTDADAKTGLEKVTAEITTNAEHATVTARYPNDLHPSYAVSVGYIVTAPAGTRVTIESLSSHVSVTGIHGDVDARTTSGPIEVISCTRVGTVHTAAGDITLTDSGSDTKIDVGSMSSGVKLTNIKAPRVSASVISGNIIAHGIQADAVSLGSISGEIEFSGAVTPKGRYEFQAHSGNVKLAITGGGFDLEGKTFSGKVEADPALQLVTTTTASTRVTSLRGSVGSGGAVVVATTFSGNVWVGKKLQ
jgi:hypothetical protein